MPIPDYQSLMLPVLRLAGDRKEHSVAEIRQRIAAEFKLSEKELTERLASDSQTVFANRIGWAVQYLKAAVALKAVRRGVYQITERGLAVLKERPRSMPGRFGNFPNFWSSRRKELLQIQRWFQPLHHRRSRQHLKNRWSRAIRCFERRWQPNCWRPSKPAHQPPSRRSWWIFSWQWDMAALLKMPERSSANLETAESMASFSPDALEYVEEMPQRIILIDGRQLASLMIEHNVGVAPAKTYTLKRMDQDYFENL
jgi:restriction system protein